MSVVGGLQTGERTVAGLAGLGNDPSKCGPPIGRRMEGWTFFFFPLALEARRRARWRELARPRVGKTVKQLSFDRQAEETADIGCTVLLTARRLAALSDDIKQKQW